MNRGLSTIAIAISLLVAACGHDSGAKQTAYFTKEQLMDPASCAGCHPKHYQEWSGSMHAYASDDPVFVAMNKRGQREAQIGPFCVNCHAPMAVQTGATSDGLNLDSLPAKLKGVTCYFCHSADAVLGTHDNPIRLAEDGVMRGPFDNPVANTAHPAAYSTLLDRDRLESVPLCGSCHDIENGHGADIERTFAEWRETVYSQPKVGTTCGQCHMDRSAQPEPIANVAGVYAREFHSHRFPGVDVALTPFAPAEADAQEAAVKSFLHTTLRSAICVRGIGASTTLQVVLDNVAAGHRWPSGAAQDRRAWVEVTASASGSPIYQSGVVAAGTDVTALADPDLWLIRDCLIDEQGNLARMFWQAASFESNLLPGQLTFDQTDPRFYQTHVVQTYPRGGSATALSAYPDQVSVRVHLVPIGLDVIADLAASGDLSASDEAALAQALPTFDVGDELVWTPDSATETYIDKGIPVSCATNTVLAGSADKVPAVSHMKCKP